MANCICAWVHDEFDRRYHDEEWGKPCHDDRHLFEMLILEGFQAGLSWNTILRKRENFRKAFDGFHVEKVASYQEEDIQRLLQDSGIIRNRLKIRGAVKNANAFLQIQKEYGSFDRYIWSFVNHQPIINAYTSPKEIPSSTAVSDHMSKELKKRGFTFVGTTICYSFMQAVGMVNDHEVHCREYQNCISHQHDF